MTNLTKGVGGLLLPLLFLSSCGPDGGRFRLEGRFRHLNQGEFYIYEPYSPNVKTDTIKVADGRFSYEADVDGRSTFILLFPNFSEQVVFAQSGKTVTIQGDASHLKEMEIKGTEENELMSKFREAAGRLTPPEAVKEAARFVEEHPKSIVSLYLVRRYFLHSDTPNYAEATRLLTLMLKADPQNAQADLLLKSVKSLKGAAQGSRLPSFSATDTEGRNTGSFQLKAKVNIVNVWTTWNNSSQNLQIQIKKLRKQYGSDVACISICLDASRYECRKVMRRDSISWPNVCDGKMWDSPLVAQFGIGAVPTVIVADKTGKVVARGLDADRLKEKVEAMMK